MKIYQNYSEETITEPEEVDEFRDLGVITDHHIRWNSQVNCVVAMANRMLGLIKKSCKGLNNEDSRDPLVFFSRV